jgi:hypothetical protein
MSCNHRDRWFFCSVRVVANWEVSAKHVVALCRNFALICAKTLFVWAVLAIEAIEKSITYLFSMAAFVAP